MTTAAAEDIQFAIFDRRVRTHCEDATIANLVRANFGRMECDEAREGPAPLEYRIVRGGDGFIVERAGAEPVEAAGEGHLLYLLEKNITVELQKLRRDLYFLHAAALEREGAAFLVVGDSGAGKSSLAWALTHHGLAYLSDELAPVSPADLRVHGYPHALCLKSPPPEPYTLPASTLRTESTLHVPAREAPAGVSDAGRLSAIFFLEPRSAAPSEPAIGDLGAAEAAARLLANALNPLAHPASGLEPAAEIARAASRFRLRAAELGPTCELVLRTLERGATG